MATATPDLTDLYGAAFIGLLVTCFLSGIMTLQVHFYFQQSSQKDPKRLKLLVAGVWILDMTHLVGISIFVYHYVISNWGNEDIIGKSTWTLGFEEMLNTWITFIVQMFFIYRICVLTRYPRWYLTPLYLLAFVHLGFGTGGGIKSMLPQTVGHLASTRWRAAIWLISGAINDILIAAILCYFLRAQRTVMSQRLIDRLIAYTINTGLLTSILAFVDIGLFIKMPGNYIHLAFNFTIGRIYTNSLMGTLNLRNHLRRATAHHPSTSGSSKPTETTSISTQFAGNPSKRVIIDRLPPLASRTEHEIGQVHFPDDKSKLSLQDNSHYEETPSATAIELGSMAAETQV